MSIRSTVFYRSDATATINFSVRLGAAFIRERRLLATRVLKHDQRSVYAQNDRVC